MRIFEKKEITPPKRVCLRLKEARENAHVSLQDLSDELKINKEHLVALEECRFNDIPYATIYKKNFIRRYAKALNLPIDEILGQFISEEDTKNTDGKKNISNRVLHKHRFQNLPSFFRTFLIFLSVSILIGYLGWQIRSIIRPPELVLFSPENGFVTEKYELLVHGRTNDETQVYVNGKEITNREDGQFRETINLSPGINTITVSAKKKHGKSTTEIRHVTLKATPSQTVSYKNP